MFVREHLFSLELDLLMCLIDLVAGFRGSVEDKEPSHRFYVGGPPLGGRSSRCITWRSHEPGASNSTPACGLPMRSAIAHSLD